MHIRIRVKRRRIRGPGAVAVLVVMAALAIGLGGFGSEPFFLEGAWLWTITVQSPVGPLTFPAVTHFTLEPFAGSERGGVVGITPVIPARTPDGMLLNSPSGIGAWEKTGEGEYLGIELHIVSNEAGFAVGTLVIRYLITEEGPDTFSFRAQNKILDLEGNLLLAMGEGVGTASRVAPEPLD